MTKNLPYHEFRSDVQVSLAIIQGRLPSWPSSSDPLPDQSQRVCKIAESCWRPVPERPSIRELLEELSQVDDSPTRPHEYGESQTVDISQSGLPSLPDKDTHSFLATANLSINDDPGEDENRWQRLSQTSTPVILTEQDSRPLEGGESGEIANRESDLAMQCFAVMEEGLHFNICGLETSFSRNMDVPDLRGRVKENIPVRLENACTSWFKHLVEAPASSSLLDALSAFAHERLLFWFEVMSLLRKFRAVVSRALLRVASWAVSVG